MRSRTRPRSAPVAEGPKAAFGRCRLASGCSLNIPCDCHRPASPAHAKHAGRGGAVAALAMRRPEGTEQHVQDQGSADPLSAAGRRPWPGGLLWHESEILPQSGHTVVSGQIAVGGPYALTDQDGTPALQHRFSRQIQLIYFGYSFCPDVCPTTLAVMAAGAGQAGHRRRTASCRSSSPSIPARDTPAVLEELSDSVRAALCRPDRHAGPDRGGGKGISRLSPRNSRLPGGTYGMDHSSVIYLMGPDGKLGQLLRRSDLAGRSGERLKQKILQRQISI